jgi:hypothetical protein
MAESNYEQAIFILARTNSRSSPKALPKIRGDTHGTRQKNAKWATINQKETASQLVQGGRIHGTTTNNPSRIQNDVHGGLTLGKPPVSNEIGLCMS